MPPPVPAAPSFAPAQPANAFSPSAAPPPKPSFANPAADDLSFAAPSKGSAKLGRLERSALIGLAVIGLLLTLYRNDILGGVARSIGAESAYKSVSSALGGPSRDTPQGVRAFTASLPALSPPEALKPKPTPPRAVERPPASTAASPAAPPPRAAAKSAPSKSKKAKPAKGKNGKSK
jgi:hypothetical protein